MAGRIVTPPPSVEKNRAVLPLDFVGGLLDTIEKPLVVAERNGNLLLVNTRARQCLEFHGYTATQGLNLFDDLLHSHAGQLLVDLEKTKHQATLHIHRE